MALYLSIMLVCYLFADKVVKNEEKFRKLISPLGYALYVLIFTMALRIGSNEKVISNLGSIGVQAFITNAMAVLGSMLVAFIARKLMRLDKRGLKKQEKIQDTESSKDDTRNNLASLKSSAVTLAVAAMGILVGYLILPKISGFYDQFQSVCGEVIQVALCILLASVGLDLGLQGAIISKFKAIGLKLIVLPIAVMIGTFGTGVIYGLFSDFSMKESIAIFGGMAWYSLAPAVIMEAGYIEASAVSFLHNIFREVSAILFIPFVANKIGYYEAIAIPGSPGMDVCLPIAEKFTNSECTIYSLISGIVLSLGVPIWMPLIVG